MSTGSDFDPPSKTARPPSCRSAPFALGNAEDDDVFGGALLTGESRSMKDTMQVCLGDFPRHSLKRAASYSPTKQSVWASPSGRITDEHPNLHKSVSWGGQEDDCQSTSLAARTHGAADDAALFMTSCGGHDSPVTLHPASKPFDAQELYPPSACVFVANLPEGSDDHTLVAAVTREFNRFGTVSVKLRRDAKNMPFAFCQYTRDEHARAAVEQGRGIIIGGRSCRTEMVRGNVHYIVAKRSGQPVTVEAAHALLAKFGQIAKVELLTKQVCDIFSLDSAALVTFARYDAQRNPPAAFRDDPEYRVELFDLKRSQAPKVSKDDTFLEQYDQDRRSIYVGGLDYCLAEEDVRRLMERVGPVMKVTLIKKSYATAPHQTAFAFVEFERMDMPDKAIDLYSGATVEGHILRVERKQVRDIVRTPISKTFDVSSRPLNSGAKAPILAPKYRAATSPIKYVGASTMPMPMAITAQDNYAQNTEMELRRDHSQYTPTHFGCDGPHITTTSLQQARSPRAPMDARHDYIPSAAMDAQHQHGYCQHTPVQRREEYSHTECSQTPEVVVTEPEQCITPMSQPSHSPGRFYHTVNMSAGACGSIPRGFMDVGACSIHSSLPPRSLPRAHEPGQYPPYSPPNAMGPDTPQDTPPIPFAHHHPYYSRMHSTLYNEEPFRHQYAQFGTPTHMVQRSPSHMLSPTRMGRDASQDPNDLLHQVSSMRLEHTGPISDNPFRAVCAQDADLGLASVSQAPIPHKRSEDFIQGHHGVVAHGHA